MKKLYVPFFVVCTGIQLLSMESSHKKDLDQQIQSKLDRSYWHNAENIMEEIVHLIELGGNPDFQDNNGNTPLHIACGNNRIAMVQTLIQCGASTHIKNKSDNTPLDSAKNAESIEIIHFLEQTKS
ncbi:MAG TPA: ankyrin repeat domain-containing protein [Candidatus Dependentiae bacterium]|nr:ankyrin repeat domain-containing protein [Candidatus Dependentiae bacterium]HRQ62411.1 ankyrin repeat domain-containing protein [Candidatus Dependentiae bacterium]